VRTVRARLDRRRRTANIRLSFPPSLAHIIEPEGTLVLSWRTFRCPDLTLRSSATRGRALLGSVEHRPGVNGPSNKATTGERNRSLRGDRAAPSRAHEDWSPIAPAHWPEERGSSRTELRRHFHDGRQRAPSRRSARRMDVPERARSGAPRRCPRSADPGVGVARQVVSGTTRSRYEE
jgi:hypothetical protein